MNNRITTASDDDGDDRKKAQVFFARGRTVADTSNFEYAIEMYIKGLAFDADNLDAHKALREISLQRTAKGGKPMGLFEKMKQPKAVDEKSKMLAAENLLAYAPRDVNYMTALHHAAKAGAFTQTEAWIEQILQQMLRSQQRRGS